MKIKRLVIENFKSIERIELVEPNPFTVFVGPNGSGKSNIFEALEFVNLKKRLSRELAMSLFGGKDEFLHRQSSSLKFKYRVESNEFIFNDVISYEDDKLFVFSPIGWSKAYEETQAYKQFFDNYTRLFVKNDELVRLVLNDDRRLSLSAKNLEKVLRRILSQQDVKTEIFEWLELFVPGFMRVEVVSNPFSGEETLLWYEQHSEKPFTKALISDGTYNILALLAAVYQSDEPQFLCIEEPENGLHPQVAKELINFFRLMCEEKGHHIWINTHSQSMVSQLTPDEMIVVEKKQGATQIFQFKGRDMHGLRMDEALLMNVLGVGLAW